MMELRIITSSAAVKQTLQTIATASGFTLAQDASCILETDGNSLCLRNSDQIRQRLPLPVRPSAVARLLAEQNHSLLPPLQGNWQFDATARQLLREDSTVSLTEKEALLLTQLLSAHPASCSRDMLLKNVWSMQSDVETHTLETHIYRLRGKLSELTPKPCDIITSGNGYQLTMEIA